MAKIIICFRNTFLLLDRQCAHSKSTMDVLKQENDLERCKKRRHKVISRRAYSTSTKAASTSHSEGIAFDGIQKAKRWRLKEEIIKLFDDSIKRSFPEFEGEKPVICASQRPGRGDFNWYVLMYMLFMRFYFLSFACNI